MEKKVPVVVTGFGPFGEHKVNASGEAVKELSGIKFEDNINLITQEIPVEYETVSSLVPDLWQKYKPKVCVHVGVSSITNTMQLEMCAHNSHYHREDISCKYPDGQYCVLGGEECLHTRIDVKKICEDRDDKKCPCDLETSCDAGSAFQTCKFYIEVDAFSKQRDDADGFRSIGYLCEFVYYVSLNESKRPEHSGSLVVFIHVPALGNPYSKTQLAHSLKYVVSEILKQLS